MKMIYTNIQLISQWIVWYCMLQKNIQNYDLKIVNSSMQTHKSQLIKQTMIYGRVNC